MSCPSNCGIAHYKAELYGKYCLPFIMSNLFSDDYFLEKKTSSFDMIPAKFSIKFLAKIPTNITDLESYKNIPFQEYLLEILEVGQTFHKDVHMFSFPVIS